MSIDESSSINWIDPNHAAIFKQREEVLERIREDFKRNPKTLDFLKLYYRDHPWDFISDWGITFDPRNAEIGLPTYIPFILFPKQIEWVKWVMKHWRERTPGLCEKSRDMGVSWLAMALSCTLCLFNRGMVIGVGSRKKEYVDKVGAPKALLPKARIFMENLPVEFTGDWKVSRDAPYMRISFPETGSIIGGEGGDDIGRGDRTAIYFVDEYAHFEHPELTEASLSQTTNCRIDMSSVRGMNNPFARKRFEEKVDVFVFDWKDDPRKDGEWYAKQCAQLDPVVVAQEIDRDYHASATGVVIPNKWVMAAVDAHKKLGIAPSGQMGCSIDVADEGLDKNAACISHGVEVLTVAEWSGQGGDIFRTVERAFELCDEYDVHGFDYDSDGLGAGVRGDARVINDQRKARREHQIEAKGFRGSEAPFDPDRIVGGTIGDTRADRGRANKDYFANRKAQGWWALRKRFRNTYRRVVEKIECPPDEIISISSKCPNYQKLCTELSQPTYRINGAGKIVIDKTPEGAKSPNLADAVMIRFAPKEAPRALWTPEVLAQIKRAPKSGRG